LASECIGVHRTSHRKGSSSISTTFNVSEMMKGNKKYRYNCRRKLFTPDRRVKLFVFTLLLITAIGMEITSGREKTGIISEL
jgi:hypothetical protein